MTVQGFTSLCDEIHATIIAVIEHGAHWTRRHIGGDAVAYGCDFDFNCNIYREMDTDTKNPVYCISFGTPTTSLTLCFDFTPDTRDSDSEDLYYAIAKCFYDTAVHRLTGHYVNADCEDIDHIFNEPPFLDLIDAITDED